MEDPATEIVRALAATVEFARVSERIYAALAGILPVQQSINRIVADDLDAVDLSPELLVVVNHLGEAADALTRAFEVANTNFDVTMEKLGQSLNKGGSE